MWRLIALACIVIGAILRVTLRSSTTLWEDEIIAATHAVQPWWRVIVDCIVNDMHPPLYFFELHLWSLVSQADGWLIANSAVFSLLAVVSLFVVARRRMDNSDALTVAAVFGALPVCLWMAEEVRMYALLSVLLIWMYDATDRAFARNTASQARPIIGWRSYIRVGLLGVLIVYTHAIGFIAVLFFGLYAASWLVTRKAALRDWLVWMAVFGGVGILALPMLVADLIHDADMPPLQGLGETLDWMSGVVAGNGYRLVGWLQPAGLLVYLAASIGGVVVARTRRLACCFLIAPMALCILIDLLARPLFKTDFFSNFYSPFLALVIGSLLVQLPVRRGLRVAALAATLTALLVMGITGRRAINTTEDYYRSAIAEIAANKQPGDVIWAPQGDIFWGVCWYMIGPQWGSPVTVTAPLRQGSHWHKVFDLLGPRIVADLDLLPKSQAVTAPDGTVIMTAASSFAAAETAPRVWLVTYPGRSDLAPGLPQHEMGGLTEVQAFTFKPLEVDLYRRR